MTPRILIIAGSDSGGGAGIQADIKTVTMLGGHAMTAITAITAQNTLGVQAVHAVPTDMVVAQMRSCLEDIGVDAVKIGMIGSAETAHAVADVLEALFPGLRRGTGIPIVFDPVMVATSGSVLADAATIAAFGRLMRLATLVTPNTAELEALSGHDAQTEHDAENAATILRERYGSAVLAKGGHRVPEGGLLSDVLVQAQDHPIYWTGSRIDTPHSHGTGCTLASAIAAGLGAGMALDQAIGRAHRFVRAALLNAPGLGQGHGPMGHALGVVPFDVIGG